MAFTWEGIAQFARMQALYALDPDVILEQGPFDQSSAFFYACKSGHKEAIKWLYSLDRSWLFDQVGGYQFKPANIRTPFIEACRFADSKTVRLLAELDPIVLTQRDSFGFTGFYYLCCRNKVSDIKFLCTQYNDQLEPFFRSHLPQFLGNPRIHASTQNVLNPVGYLFSFKS